MNTQLTGQEGYRGIYLERGGESARVFVSELLEAPEFPLDDQELLHAHEYELSIAEAQLPGGKTIAETLKASSKADETKVAPLIMPHYLLNGAIDVAGYEGLESASTPNEVYEWFATQAKRDPATALELTKKMSEVYIATIAGKLSNSEAIVPEEYAAESRVINPEALLEVASSAVEARALLLEERSLYRDAHGAPGLDGAKSAIVDVYLGRVNSDLASYIPTLVTLREQAILSGDTETAERATELIPRGMRRAIEEEKSRKSLMKRLDYIRNGMGESETGEASSVTRAVIESAQDAAFVEGAIFSPEQVKVLKETLVDPDTMQMMFESILHKAALLAGPDDTPGEGKFHVLINPDKATFAVNGVNGEYKVASRPQSLYKIITVGGFHELQHINQSLADGLLGQSLQIGKLKGKRVSMLREGGANAVEREAETKLFGYSKPIALTYAKALLALENGGTTLDAITAFAQEKMRVVEGVSMLDAAKEAADRVLRITRKGGLSSHVMAFAEEAILKSEVADMDPAAKSRAAAMTGLDLVDQARLHKYGLLPPVADNAIDWAPHIASVLSPYIHRALHGDEHEDERHERTAMTQEMIER